MWTWWLRILGLRIWGRKLLFVGTHGKAVVIRKENGFFRTVVLVPENPDELRRRIKQVMQ
ncbi:hypothetical protein FTO70_09415 [Methanosarcina sp. KYL-1]|uniref:hypothetical protein n=1 Tax=Methanosarcina sp. KYL-1 TaxID=2602068 RepID=UPI00210178F5|nr:hypothetical protein [Methanosarcina sp. KYL-1]MCQ1535893.1 hypothetical protein [Methanosarcina sp. KYL-1]